MFPILQSGKVEILSCLKIISELYPIIEIVTVFLFSFITAVIFKDTKKKMS